MDQEDEGEENGEMKNKIPNKEVDSEEELQGLEDELN